MIVNADEELCQYLRENQFHEFMMLWKEQYKHYGQCGGTIHLPLTDDNKETIELFMGKDYHKQSHAVIRYKQLLKVIKTSKFEGADFNKVLHLYFDEEIITNKSARERRIEAFEEFLESVCCEYPNSYADKWLRAVIQDRNSAYIHIKQDWKKRKTVCYKELGDVMKAINKLPLWSGEKQNISVFASSITGDPHAFDKNSLRSYLLFHAICYYLNVNKSKYSGIERNEILYEAGLYHDSVSNFCSVAHIQAYQHSGELHPGWKGFYDTYEAFNATSDNLEHIYGIDKKTCSRVLIVENPSVFQLLVKRAKEKQYSSIGFICTNGQLNATAYKLLDLLKLANIKMYYGGDMDPEGLLIADRLKQRYGKCLELWRYSNEDFYKSISAKKATPSRISQCNKLINEQLKIISFCLPFGLGYQENIVQDYLKDLDEMANNITIEKGGK